MFKFYTLTFLMTGFCLLAKAQTEFTLQPSSLIPEENGFYRAGITYDFDGDGNDDFVKGCGGDIDFEDYERRDPFNVTYDLHIENGSQAGFTYKNCMIMPTCSAKYDSDLDPAISEGFIQIRPLIDTTDVDLMYSYILSPEVSNIQSITVEASADVSIQVDRRNIPFNIEYSTDGGETFSYDYYIQDYVQFAGGYRVTYTTDTNVDFQQIAQDSKTKNVILRFIGNLDNSELGADKGQYVKFHKITIMADEPMVIEEPTLSTELGLKNDLSISNGVISAKSGDIAVYSLAGKMIGKGSEVRAGKGLFVVVSESGIRQKIFIQ